MNDPLLSMNNSDKSGSHLGFTLVELLVVISIVIILAALVAPITGSIVEGNALTRAGLQVEQTLVKARQNALTRNRTTEVRFYKYQDSTSPDTTKQYHSVQIFEMDDNGSGIPISKMSPLPAQIRMNESTTLSDLLSDSTRTKSFSSTDPQVILPGTIAKNYTASHVLFYPDGSTDLSTTGGTGGTGKWFVLLHASKFDVTKSEPPDNFYAIQIDPVVGTLRTLRP